jgi:polar amino acid transport system ATP-binding protein
MEPVLLLFDEITSALDPQLTSEVVRVLEELAAAGRTMILVTHEMGFARRAASQIVFMHNGRIWEHGQSQKLLNNPRSDELKTFLAAILRA